MIFDPNDQLGAHALKRLSDDKIGWLTTVTPGGQPQKMPIWFLWADGELLICGDHRARRNANLAIRIALTRASPSGPEGVAPDRLC